jgi:BirA family transcriptional regulator, biotin operon repressor / biotin---[acetyl-CoA-carboxylase] ligase
MVSSDKGFAERLKASLSTKRFRQLRLRPHWIASVDSTQNYLSRVLRSVSEGEFVISTSQTRGRGREGRSWHSDHGGLYLSITLRPQPQNLPKLALLCANSVMRTLSSGYSLPCCRIKEPNDVSCNGKKISGILVDAEIKGKNTLAFVGVGVNVNNGLDWDNEMSSIATSYVRETGKTIPLEEFAVSLLGELDQDYYELLEDTSAPQKRNIARREC